MTDLHPTEGQLSLLNLVWDYVNTKDRAEVYFPDEPKAFTVNGEPVNVIAEWGVGDFGGENIKVIAISSRQSRPLREFLLFADGGWSCRFTSGEDGVLVPNTFQGDATAFERTLTYGALALK